MLEFVVGMVVLALLLLIALFRWWLIALFVSSSLPTPPIAALLLWEAVISVGCSRSEGLGLGRKRNDAASQGRGVDGLCDYRFDA